MGHDGAVGGVAWCAMDGRYGWVWAVDEMRLHSFVRLLCLFVCLSVLCGAAALCLHAVRGRHDTVYLPCDIDWVWCVFISFTGIFILSI